MAGKKYGLGEQYKSLGGAMNVQKASVGLLIKGMRVASKAFKGKGVPNKFIDRTEILIKRPNSLIFDITKI